MRLLQRDDVGNYSFAPDLTPNNVPPYAILSHTWGSDEVLFSDMVNRRHDWQQKAGYDKIRFCADQTTRHGLRYFWVDSCCIDKSDSIELQTAINSMFRWYRDAKICFVYLSDVCSSTATSTQDGVATWGTAFQDSGWFTRGWTLQELIAPKAVEFYSREETWLGDKQSLEPQLRDITRIPTRALRGAPLSNFTIAEREAWARGRQTKYEEDMAYSLLGIFDVHMPLIYGEGRQNAQRRLREEAEKAVKGAQYIDFSVVFSLSDVPETQHFVARTGELIKMRETLTSDGSRRVVVLHGLGGIGKTQISIAYTKRYKDEYSAIFWLNIKDKTSMQQSFTKVARQILLQHPNASHLKALDLRQDQEKVVEAVKSWLSLPGNTRWLLVYDNYDNPKLSNDINDTGININQFIPEAYQGSIIVTTRLSQVDLGYRIQVRKLESLHDSLEILATTSGRDGLDTDISAKRLVEELDGLPLALATAGTYLRHVPISLANYLRLYKESWVRLHTDTPNLGSYQDRTLCSTWQLSYVQVQTQDRLAACLLRWWAYFNNEDIWFELLQAANTDDPAWIQELGDELNFNQAIGSLHNYGFVEPYVSTSDSIGSRGYSMHACVHSWTASVLNKEPEDSLARATVACVAARAPSQNEHRFWSLQNRLLSHAAKCSVMRLDSDEGIEWAFHKIGDLYADQCKLGEAEAMYLRALQGKEKAWGPEHTSTLDTVNNLGNLYKNQGKLGEAEAMYLRALRGYKKTIVAQNLIKYRPAINTTQNLGFLLLAQGKRDEAKSLLKRAHANLEALLGPSHIDVQSLQKALEDFNQPLHSPQRIRRRDMVKHFFINSLAKKNKN
ncbi:P-loop containing nucleoside triphosphate hydrolase protein [Xylariaceae sp. AK1471]|nr:P-loop containing nucleoside triphosphate hydrolase protein [Xylariaceae sp. AK1471]